MPDYSFLSQKLEKRKEEGLLRSLKYANPKLIDFSSNDYLGFAKESFSENNSLKKGSGGSRLLTGNYPLIEEVEKQIAEFHKGKYGLVFNSGYDANIGILSCIPAKDDIILYDELCHASLIDGMRLSFAEKFKFKHNDAVHLEELLKKNSGKRIFIVLESVYSMDGDSPDLLEIVSLLERYSALMILDEAHSTGVFGEKGEGRAVELGIQDKIFIRVVTFGKAIGLHGAIAIFNDELIRQFLINFSRPFIYTTAPSESNLFELKSRYDILSSNNNKVLITNYKIKLFKSLIEDEIKPYYIESSSAIQSFLAVGGNEKAKKFSSFLMENGFDVRPILSPTVPKGKERIRICLHSYNSDKEITELVNCIHAFYES